MGSVLRVFIIALVAHAVSGEVEVQGILTDIFCWDIVVALDGANMRTEPEKHTVHCLRDIPRCIDSGYGILEKPDGASEFTLKYTFDDAGNGMVTELLRQTNRINNYIVVAKGEADGSILKVSSLAEPSEEAAEEEAGEEESGDGDSGSEALADVANKPMEPLQDGDGAVAKTTDIARKPAEPLLLAHIVCMCLSWGLFLPWGVTIAAWGRSAAPRRDAWLVLHKRLQTIGWVFQLVGIACIVTHVQGLGKTHFGGPHQIFGVIVVVIGTLQPLNALVRPQPHEPKSSLRRSWEITHKGLGYAAIVLGLFTIPLGIAALANYGYALSAVGLAVALYIIGAAPPVITYIAGLVAPRVAGKAAFTWSVACGVSRDYGTDGSSGAQVAEGDKVPQVLSSA